MELTTTVFKKSLAASNGVRCHVRATLALSLLIFLLSPPAFPAPASAATAPARPSDVGGQAEVQTYDDLLRAIRQVRVASQKRIDQAIHQEKVRAAWETGKLIDEHVLQHKERADYGEQVIIKLAMDLGTNETELKYMLQFARTYPIRPPADELSWGHFQALLSLNDWEERETVAKEAVRQHWSRDRLREEIRKRKAAKEPSQGMSSEFPLTATPGKPGTYRVVVAVDGPYKKQLALDLGFSSFFRPEKFGKFKPGEIVTLQKGKLKRNDREGAGKDLFTYPVYVRHVIDGDTFSAMIDLGFGITTIQKLRLRGLDAPEIESTEGQEAKDFLATLLARSSLRVLGTGGTRDEGEAIPTPVLIRTEKSDKYDRYLADVWVDETYVNQELLSHGLAVRVNE